jgi:hypothetical protein
MRVEYWVYSPTETRPTDQAIMESVLKGSMPPDHAACLTMSDVRFHIGGARRIRNPIPFRPEALAEADADFPPDLVKLVDACEAIFIVRFVSEETPQNKGALVFATRVAAAIAELARSPVVWDTESQTFFVGEDIRRLGTADAASFDLQVGVRWSETPEEGRAFTRGMAKAGLPDVELTNQPLDQRILAMFLAEGAAKQAWEGGDLSRCEMTGYGEVFDVDFGEPHPGAPTHRGWISSLHAMRKRMP